MGSGPSKKSQPEARKTVSPKPVANVNNEEKIQSEEINQTPQKEFEKKRRDEDEARNIKKDKEREKSKKMKIDVREKENMITYEDDSDIDNDIDEVLKIPMAIEYPKPKKKDKNKKVEDVVGYDSKLDRDLFHSNSNGYTRNEDLPETYAQRLQRQQYKLQQDLLIRQKTMHRDSREWDDFENEEEENFKSKGFDASKFRAANKGADMKKDIFGNPSNLEAERGSPQYLEPEPDMEDFQVNRKPPSPSRNLPSYNQSEIDLMQELERDLL